MTEDWIPFSYCSSDVLVWPILAVVHSAVYYWGTWTEQDSSWKWLAANVLSCDDKAKHLLSKRLVQTTGFVTIQQLLSTSSQYIISLGQNWHTSASTALHCAQDDTCANTIWSKRTEGLTDKHTHWQAQPIWHNDALWRKDRDPAAEDIRGNTHREPFLIHLLLTVLFMTKTFPDLCKAAWSQVSISDLCVRVPDTLRL